MLNPTFKGFHLVSFYVGREQRMFIVEEYDVKALYPMVLKCYQIYYILWEKVNLVVLQIMKMMIVD
jgi:hypothetical protein